MPVKILVVDDEPDLEILLRQRFRQQLKTGHYAMLFARNGNEALRIVEEEPGLDLVVTDLNMPEMDGLTLLAKLAERETPLKAIVISAYDDMHNIRAAMNRGAFDFLTKPIDFQDLEITLEKTLREVARMREGANAREHLAAVRSELEVAARIQQAILPRKLPPALAEHGISLCADMLPAHHIGGDWYDYFLSKEGWLGLIVGDVSGKGVPAALLMAVARSMIKGSALTGVTPSECVAHVNRLLCRDNAGEMFITLFYAQLGLETGHVRYCNAGHNPPLRVLANGAVETVPPQGGLVLGIEPEVEYTSGAFTMLPGETLLLYTDGVTEAMDASRQLYGEKRLVRQLRLGARGPLDQLFGAIKRDLAQHAGDQPQHDDITMLAARYKQPET